MSTISGPIFGYVIRYPGKTGGYVFGTDPKKLKDTYYEGFNPVCALVQLDQVKQTIDESENYFDRLVDQTEKYYSKPVVTERGVDDAWEKNR